MTHETQIRPMLEKVRDRCAEKAASIGRLYAAYADQQNTESARSDRFAEQAATCREVERAIREIEVE